MALHVSYFYAYRIPDAESLDLFVFRVYTPSSEPAGGPSFRGPFEGTATDKVFVHDFLWRSLVLHSESVLGGGSAPDSWHLRRGYIDVVRQK
jgi:hypothetical protein